MSYAWTEERIEQMKTMATDGQSCSAIARALGGGVSRCAVIGKLHRMGLSTNAKPGVPAQSRPTPIRKAAMKPPVQRDAEHPVPVGVEGEIGIGCKFIHGDPGLTPWRMCGHPAKGSYCEFHARRVVA